jgi:hypothetical protein
MEEEGSCVAFKGIDGQNSAMSVHLNDTAETNKQKYFI